MAGTVRRANRWWAGSSAYRYSAYRSGTATARNTSVSQFATPITSAVNATAARPTRRAVRLGGAARLASASSSVSMKYPVMTGLITSATNRLDVSVTMSVSGM